MSSWHYALKQDKELAEESANTLDESNISNQLFLTLLNPEPLLAKVLLTVSSSSWPLTFPPDNVIRYFFLQMLPTSAYWPKFLGACGRLAVFEVLTPKINHKCARFASRIWESRWKIMPRLLGEKEQNFLFIWSGLIKNSEMSLHSWHEWLQAGNAFDRERAGTFLLSHRLGSRKLCRHNWHHESEFKILSSSKKTSQSLNLARQVSLVDLEHLIVVNTSRLWAERADPHISDNWGSR